MISAVVLTKDEEKNLPQCLESIKWVDEILVIDDNSTDKTLEIAKKFGAKIFSHPLNNNFAQQRNFALRQVSTPSSTQGAQGQWVLFVDADERVTPQLKKEILNSLRYTSVSKYEGFWFKRYDFFGGRALKYGETANVRLLRLGRKGKGEWRREVHEVWEIDGQVKELKNPILHYPHQTITEFLEHENQQSTLHAQALKKDGVKPSLFRIVANPLGKFIQNYIFRLGFLDGMPGLIVALMMSFHSFLARAKLYFLWKK